MSGSGGSGPIGGGSGGGGSCSELRLERNLEGPVPDVVNELQLDDELRLALRDGPPTIVAVVDDQGRDAGAITPTGQLIECLRSGHEFVATVTSAEGGAIWLEIRAAR